MNLTNKYEKNDILFCVVVAIFIAPIFVLGIFTHLALIEQREEITVADCKQLLDIYLNDEGKYLPSSEQVAKKHFDVKCVANPYLEAIP